MSKVENSEISDIKTWICHTIEMREITGGKIFLVSTKFISEYAMKSLNRAEISEISKSKIKILRKPMTKNKLAFNVALMKKNNPPIFFYLPFFLIFDIGSKLNNTLFAPLYKEFYIIKNIHADAECWFTVLA